MMAPSPNGSNGRNSRGQFAKGNSGGPGNPLAAKTAKLRSTMINAVTQKEVRQIVKRLVEQAIEGDTAAAKLVLERLFGKPRQAIDLESNEDLGIKIYQFAEGRVMQKPGSEKSEAV